MSDSYVKKHGNVKANICSHDGKNCAVFMIVDFVPCYSILFTCKSYYIAHLMVRNQVNHQYARIEFLIDEDYYYGSLDKSRVEWTHDDQLDIYIGNKPSKEVTNYFFKGLGDVKVIFHGTRSRRIWW